MKYKLSAALLSAACTHAYAVTDETLPDVVVTATRTAQPLATSLASVTVISREDIQRSQVVDVATILRGVAGVELSQNGGMGKSSSLFLRGSNSTQVLVLLDGVRINSATLGTTSLESLMLDQIERIEVVRGNVSSLYGSEAIGGVVQIFTKRGKGEPTFNVSGSLGGQSTRRASTGFAGVVDNTDFALQVSDFKTDGVSALNPALKPTANPDRDGYRNTSVSAKAGYAFSAAHRVSASLFNSAGKNQYDSAFGVATDVNNNTASIRKLSLATDNQISDIWHSHLQLAQGVDDYQDFLNGKATAFGSQYKTTQNQVTWQNTLQLASAGQLLLGLENLDQRVFSDINPTYSPSARRIQSLFAGYTGNYDANQLQVNVRQDRNSQYGNVNTGLLGYGYAFDASWRATASVSTAFRAPTFNELYYPGFGDATLRPERSRNAELGVHYATAVQQVDALYFDNRTRDLIVYGTLPAPKFFGPSNISQARTDGVEVSYAGRFGDTGVKAALTSQNPRDVTTGQVLDRRAKLHSSFAATQQLGAWQLGGEWLYSGTRQDAGKALGSYNVLNLTAGYAVNKDIKLSLRADNLTNQNDSTAYGYNPLGRRLSVSLYYQP
ncbi:MAG TPA: TonB-dependent receptor [Gallionella sp.]|nr:TonB-dependent receptor [Gallionella sp.]